MEEEQLLLQWALKGFPEETVVRENRRLNNQRVELNKRMAQLTARMEAARQSELTAVKLDEYCRLAARNIDDFTYAEKRLALEALQVSVRVDGDMVYLTGAVPLESGTTAFTLPE
ncbi:hypothetical protein ACFLUT_00120 [Chloroflexota bacterium]